MQHGHRCRWIRLALVCSLALLCLAVVGGSAGAPALAATTQGQATVQGAAGSPLVGVWVVYPFPDRPTESRITDLTPDGAMLTSEAPSMAEELGQGPAGVTQTFSSQGFGVWRPSTDGSAAFKFLEESFDPDGNFLGTVNIHGTIRLDASGNSLSGSYTVTLEMPDGTSIDVQGATPLTATRLTLTSTP